ncbi:MAG: PEP-utilizing enzyme [Candidatus Paceibacterota bacterium]|jgi:phosphohistidine swiveling domain-containing protein
MFRKDNIDDFPRGLVLGNQDIDISWVTLEVIWNGMLDKRVKDQIGIEYPKCICELIKGRTINLYVESEGLKNYINLSAEKVLTDKPLLDEYREKTIETTKEIRDFAVNNLEKIDGMSIPQIKENLQNIKRLQAECMVYGTVVAFADVYGGISNKTTDIINKRKELRHPVYVYSRVLSSSEMTLTQKAYEDIINSKLSEDELLKKYFWLDQGYIGRGLTGEKLLEIKNHKVDHEDLPRTEELLKELKLTSEEERVFEVSKELVFIKSLRADSRQYLNVVVSRIMDKIAIILGVEVNLLEVLYTEEICKLLDGDKSVLDNLSERSEHSVLIGSPSSDYAILIGAEADTFLKDRLLKEIREDTNSIKGQIASHGKVIGIVKLVFGPQHINKVNEGDILVSTATSPQLLPAMKKAAAFITDVGGITSHAAIVSRELKKPCIVGTKIATQVLKDGDKVEVDAERGIITIL